MKSLIVSCSFEIKDQKNLLNNRPDIDIYKDILKVIPGSWLVDRTESVALPFRNVVLEENKIIEFPNQLSMDLLDCALTRANDILSSQKLIYFLWSGGIDSTMALVSFIQAGATKDQLVVVCNRDSIREHSNFYQNHILGNFKLVASEEFMQRIKFTGVDGIVLSCERGDCMYGQEFGIDFFNLYGGESLKQKPTRNIIVKFFEDHGMSNKSANCWYDIYMLSASKSPRPIETVYDFSWWISFCWRWQWAHEKIKLRTNIPVDIQTFFSSPQLQQWSINHRQSKITTLSDFKYDFKKLIFDYTKDQDYFDKKIKHPSATIYYAADSYVAIDSEHTKIRAKDFKLFDYYTKENFISDWLTN